MFSNIQSKNSMHSRRWTPLLIILFLTLFWAACKTPSALQNEEKEWVIPTHYQSPEQRTLTQSMDSSNNIANLPWEGFFKDSSLKKLIQQGLTFNYDLKRAVNRLDIARVNLKQAKLLQLPTLGIMAEGSSTRISDNGLTGNNMNGNGTHHYEDFLLQGQLSWEADIWGKIRNQQKYVLENYLRTSEASQAVRTRLIAEIAKGYYNLLILEKQYEIARSSLILADSTLELTRLLKSAGKANQLSVQQTAAQRETVALLLPDLEDQILRQQNALRELTGVMPGTIGDHGTLNQVQLPAVIQSGVPAELLGNRPDVRAAELSLKMAISKIAVSKANLYPTLRITATGGIESLKASSWFNLPASLFGIVSGSLLQPIFQQGALRRNYQVAQLEKQDAVLAFRASVLHSVTEVTNTLNHFDKLNTQSYMAERQVDTLQHGAENASLLYKSGLANYLEVISAQNNALQAELNLASIHGKELIAAVDIYRSLGGGRIPDSTSSTNN